jgi:hypothetical protein
VACLHLRLNTLLQVILCRLGFSIKYMQCIFIVALFIGMLGDVTIWLIQSYKS